MSSRIKTLLNKPFTQGVMFLFVVFGIYSVFYFGTLAPERRLNEIEIQGERAYLAHGKDGVYIIDITHPDNMVELGSYDTLGNAKRLELKRKNIYVANGNKGLLVLDHSDPHNITFAGRYDTPGMAEDVAIDNKYAYIADGNNGLVVVNIENLEDIDPPQGYIEYRPSGYLHRVIISGNKAYLADRSGRVRIVDISQPKSPEEISVIEIGAIVNDIDIQKDKAFLAASERGIVVVNIEDPKQPMEIGSFDTLGIAHALTVEGFHAYLADGPSGFKFVDVTHPDQMAEIGKYEKTINAIDLVVKDNQVYLADVNDGLKALELDYNIEAKLLTPATQPSNIVDVAFSDEIAYLANESNGVRIISVSNPQLPKEIGLYDTPGLAAAVEVSDDFIFVADKNQGLRVLIESSSTPDKIVLTERSYYKGPGETNGLAIDGNFIYLANGDGGLRVINFENPDEPREVGAEDQIKKVLSVAVLEDYAYVADDQDGLRVVEISDPAKPTLVGTYNTPGEALALDVMKVDSPSVRILVYVADGDSGLRVVDATDPRNPIEIGHNDQPGFVKDVVLAGNLAYVADATDGLWVMDVTDPTNPREIGPFENPGGAHALNHADQYVYVAAFDRGLRVFEVSVSTQPREVGFLDAPKNIVNVLVDEFAYLVDQNRGLQIVDVSKPDAPKEIGFFDAIGVAKGLDIEGDLAFMGVSDNLQIVDISEPEKPIEVSSIDLPSSVTAVGVSGEHAFVANGESGLSIINIKDPTNPKPAGAYPAQGNALHVTVDGIYAYTAEGSAGIQAVNVADRNKPKGASFINDFKDARAVLVVDEFAYIANGEGGLGVINVTKPAAPEVITSLDTPGTAMGLAEAEYHLFVADGSGGIQVFYILDRSNPLPVGSLAVSGGSVAIDVTSENQVEDEPVHFYVYSAGTDPGLQILDAKKTVQIIEADFYSSPDRNGPILFNLFIFFLSLSLWIFLSTQLVLPVVTSAERWASMQRILLFGMGQMGAGLLIREGKEVSAANTTPSNESPSDHGQGIVMVDASSAAVLTKVPRGYRLLIKLIVKFLSRFIPSLVEEEGSQDLRVVGPGVHFTQYRGFPYDPKITEKVKHIADLRQQIRGREEVHGFTRDGIEVTTNVWSIFSIGERPEVLQVTYVDGQSPEKLRLIHHDKRKIKDLTDELDSSDKNEIHRYIKETGTPPTNEKDASDHNPPPLSPYDYDRQRVFAALFSQAYDVNDDKHMHWTELPAHVAAEVFRDLLMQEVYDNLYYPSRAEDFPLTTLKTNFVRQVQNLGVLSYQVVLHKCRYLKIGDPWDAMKHNKELTFYKPKELENPKVLRKRGIKVIHAGFTELKAVSKVVQDKRYDYWSAQWEREAIETEARYNFEAARIRNDGRSKAQREMVNYFSEIFKSEPLKTEALALRVFQALESAAADPSTRSLLPDETLNMLLELKRWFLPPGDSEPGRDRISG